MGHFFTLQDYWGNAISVRNEGLTPCNFKINPLKNHRILKILEMEKKTVWINPHLTKYKINECNGNVLRNYISCANDWLIGVSIWRYEGLSPAIIPSIPRLLPKIIHTLFKFCCDELPQTESGVNILKFLPLWCCHVI